MDKNLPPGKELWSSRLMFIFAASGSAIGLGNIWKFPYVAGSNGGGSFVVIYLLCSFLIVMPIMIGEILIGRSGRGSPVQALKKLCTLHKLTPLWRLIGWSGITACVLILSFYSVIAGWIIAYTYFAASGELAYVSVSDAKNIFANLLNSPTLMIATHTIFLLATAFVVMRGVNTGIENAVKYCVPLLFLAIILLVIYAAIQGNLDASMKYMFSFKLEELNANVFQIALGQAFFSLSVGMGAIMMYGAYLPNETSIVRSSIAVVAMDTSAAVLAGLIVFSIVFQAGLDPAEGPGLVFETLPLAFTALPGTEIIAVSFFALLLVAAWTSAISLLEPGVVFLMEATGVARKTAAATLSLLIWALGIGTVYSFYSPTSVSVGDMTFFEIIDYMTSNLMLPLGGLMISLLVGWGLPKWLVRSEIDSPRGTCEKYLLFLLRYVVPPLIFLVFINSF